MEFDDNDRRPLYLQALTTTIPLDTATVAIAVDGNPYDCQLNNTTTVDGTWTTDAATTTRFRGAANPGQPGDVLLDHGVHHVEVRITHNGDTHVKPLPDILAV